MHIYSTLPCLDPGHGTKIVWRILGNPGSVFHVPKIGSRAMKVVWGYMWVLGYNVAQE